MSEFAKCASHRARERLFKAIKRQPQAFYSLSRSRHYGIYELAPTETAIARTVKGITILRRNTDDLLHCWQTSPAASEAVKGQS